MMRAGLIAVVLFLCGACANTTAVTPPPNEVTDDPSLVRLSPHRRRGFLKAQGVCAAGRAWRAADG